MQTDIIKGPRMCQRAHSMMRNISLKGKIDTNVVRIATHTKNLRCLVGTIVHGVVLMVTPFKESVVCHGVHANRTHPVLGATVATTLVSSMCVLNLFQSVL